MKGNSRYLPIGGNKATYLGAEIAKTERLRFRWHNSRFQQLRGGINHIEISHERTRHRDESLTEEEHSIWRSELAKLIRITRIARPRAIYDASAAAQTFTGGCVCVWIDVSEEKEDFFGN